MNMTAKDCIYEILFRTNMALIVSEICSEYQRIKGDFIGYSESCLERRLREMRMEGYITEMGKKIYINNRERAGKNYVEWYIDGKDKQTELF